MNLSQRPSDSLFLFLRRTVAAQIHLVALGFAGVGMAVLLPKAQVAGAAHFWACLAFLSTGSLLFLTSSVYHFLHDGYTLSPRWELFFENLDHYCIYLFIAGTYTPFLMNAVEPPWRTSLLVAIWTFAVLGIVYTKSKPYLFPVLRSRGVYTGLFIMMGWLLLFRVGEIYNRLLPGQLGLLAGGVFAYSVGALVYLTKRPVLLVGFFGYHELWHFMVLLGASLHFFFICSFYGSL